MRWISDEPVPLLVDKGRTDEDCWFSRRQADENLLDEIFSLIGSRWVRIRSRRSHAAPHEDATVSLRPRLTSIATDELAQLCTLTASFELKLRVG